MELPKPKLTQLPPNMGGNAADGEMLFRGSIIDGTALALAEVLKAKFPTPNNDIKLCVFIVEEFYRLLCISIQTDTEESFKSTVEAIISHHDLN